MITMTTLKQLQQQSEAVFLAEENTPLTFNQDADIIDYDGEKLVLCDRSNWGILSLTKEDRARFLHNQSTNDIEALKTGNGCETVFVNSTGRNIDLATAYIQDTQILLMVSPEQNKHLFDWMDRYIFPFDKVALQDLTSEYAIFTLIGDRSKESLSQWLDEDWLNNAPEYNHQIIKIEDIEVIVTVGCGLKLTGYNLIIPQAQADIIWQKLVEKNPILIGSQGYEYLRIQQGRPKPEAELTQDYNPLESGLWDAISFEKGCYIGQETIARLNTYKGVKQRLWGIKLAQSDRFRNR